MNERDRTNDERPQPPADASAAPPGGTNLNALREAGTALLAAADEAIKNVLSGDSRAFNAAVRQQGGQ